MANDPKMLVPVGSSTAIVQKPLAIRYSTATGYQTLVGATGPKAQMAAAMDQLIADGYQNAEYQEEMGGIATVHATFGSANLADPATPSANEKPEIVWELVGSDESASLDRCNAGVILEKAVPGILKAIDACVQKYQAAITDKTLWESTTGTTEFTTDPTTGQMVNVSVVDTAAIAAGIVSARVNAERVIIALTTPAGASYVTLATELFGWRIKGVESFNFTRDAIRKSITFSGFKSSIASAIIAGIRENSNRYFTTDQVLSRETTIPASLAANLPTTFIDSISGLTQGFWIKHQPNIQVSSTGRTTVSVEYIYTLDLCRFAYEAAI